MANNQSWEFYQQPETGTGIPYALWWICGLNGTAGLEIGILAGVNELAAVPFDQMRAVTVSKMSIAVTTAGGAGAKIRLGIYQNAGNANNKPAALLIDGGELDVTTTGIKTLTIAGGQNLTDNTRYWATLLCNDNTVAIQAIDPGAMFFWGAAVVNNVFQPANGVSAAQNYGALPANFPTPTLSTGGVKYPAIALAFSSVT
jgi:hypothetical protein